jgi:hypothetical protein
MSTKRPFCRRPWPGSWYQLSIATQRPPQMFKGMPVYQVEEGGFTVTHVEVWILRIEPSFWIHKDNITFN